MALQFPRAGLPAPGSPESGAIRFFPIREKVVRHYGSLGPTLGRLGSLEVRLATTKAEIRRAQRLRFKVFYEEMSAVPDGASLFSRRDVDDYDFVCDHLLVIDHDVKPKPFRKPKPKVVGTYRLLRQEVADRNWGFYTAGEYDIAACHRRPSGPALPRTRPLLRAEALSEQAHGRAALARHLDLRPPFPHRRDDRLREPRGHGSAPPRPAVELPAPPCPGPRAMARQGPRERYTAMDLLAKEAVDPKAALHALPPLVKGYLRLGATFGDGAVIDRQFGTTDVLVVLPVSAINPRYIDHFGPAADRHAA